MSGKMWAEIIKPHYSKLCVWIHRNTRWKTFLYSCGSIYHLISHMIEAGVDISNPAENIIVMLDAAYEFGQHEQ